MSDSEVIQPRKVQLGADTSLVPGFRFRYIWVTLAVGLAALSLTALILLAPEISRDPPPPPQPQTGAAPMADRGELSTPLQMQRHERALEEANRFVRQFTELEIELEDAWNVRAWGKQAFEAAGQLAIEAERAFSERDYESAMTGYTQGVGALENMLANARSNYEQQVQIALDALAERDAEAASQALDAAALYQPEAAMIESGRRRLARLDELDALLNRASEAETGGNYGEALRLAEQARAMDPGTRGIADIISRLRQAGLDAKFRAILAEGYTALDGEDFESAETAFTAALALIPGDPAARQGLDQVLTSRSNSRIRIGLAEATQKIQAEDWEGAIEALEQVRQIDPNLSEVNAGLLNARSRKALDEALDEVLRDPGRLADERRFTRASTLLSESSRIELAGPRLSAQREKLAEFIDIASGEARVTLLSDDKTDVRLQYHGDLGRFRQREMILRPGRYLIQGGRDGYRDVRFEVDVAPGEQRIEVLCEEPVR